jgi:prepilin-type N-terminal cleavage/methylation domain-containing protein/prepilin-type processing-associated H-X9-DG protein
MFDSLPHAAQAAPVVSSPAVLSISPIGLGLRPAQKRIACEGMNREHSAPDDAVPERDDRTSHLAAARVAASPAFTLIELLTVLAIVAVLAALLFPAFTSAMESNRQTKCLSNLKQIGAAVMLYAGENDGSFPSESTEQWDNRGTLPSIWPGDLGKYVGAAAKGGRPVGPPARETVWNCPAADPNRDWWGSEPDYGANINVFTRNAWGSYQPNRRLASVSYPSQCLMVADACNPAVSVRDGTWMLNVNKSTLAAVRITTAAPRSGLGPRHGYDGKDSRTGRFGALFCDGHAEMFSYGDTRLLDTKFLDKFLGL